MDLKRLKTFVTVAEHGTVSKAAAGAAHHAAGAVAADQRASSRSSASICSGGWAAGSSLTPRGEQLLGDCRSLLSHAATVSERAQALRRGDIKVLKVAASALTIEGVVPDLPAPLRRSASPACGSRLIEARCGRTPHHARTAAKRTSRSTSSTSCSVDDHRFASLPAAAIPDAGGLRAAARRSGRRHDRYPPARRASAAAARCELRDPRRVRRGMPARRRATEHLRRERRRPRPAGARRGRARRRDHPVDPADRAADTARPAGHASRSEPLQIDAGRRSGTSGARLPRYAEDSPDLLAEHMREVFPIAGPSRESSAVPAGTLHAAVAGSAATRRAHDEIPRRSQGLYPLRRRRERLRLVPAREVHRVRRPERRRRRQGRRRRSWRRSTASTR